MEKKIFGEVALTKRPEEECEMYLMNYQKGNSVYEDDYYLYNFDSDGNLIEIQNTNRVSSNYNIADEATIRAKAKSILSLYFPKLVVEDFELIIQNNNETRPAWIIELIKKVDSVVESNVRMTFDKYGNLYMAVFFSGINDIGNISKIQAVEIALSQIQSDKYNFSDFDKNNIILKIESNKRNGFYRIMIDNIPFGERRILKSIIVRIDSNSGKTLNIEIL